MEKERIDLLHTEQRNPDTIGIDRMDALEIIQKINEEDQKVALCVREALPQIAQAIELIVPRMKKGGRMVYVGAGTSGRLGFMDASECRPTFGIPEETVSCVMAGGRDAVFSAKESVEDDPVRAMNDLKEWGLTPNDTVIAAAASGRTPYCIGALDYAQSIGAGAVSLSCNPDAAMSRHAQVAIEVDTGREVIMGSTRMKAGSAQKMVCNMLTTATMIKLGKVYGNLMVDMRPTNAKLVDRAKRIVMEATGASYEQAEAMLQETGNDVKLAVFMLVSGLKKEEAESKLKAHKGYIAKALEG